MTVRVQAASDTDRRRSTTAVGAVAIFVILTVTMDWVPTVLNSNIA